MCIHNLLAASRVEFAFILVIRCVNNYNKFVICFKENKEKILELCGNESKKNYSEA